MQLGVFFNYYFQLRCQLCNHACRSKQQIEENVGIVESKSSNNECDIIISLMELFRWKLETFRSVYVDLIYSLNSSLEKSDLCYIATISESTVKKQTNEKILISQ
jgi:hypothetical protein